MSFKKLDICGISGSKKLKSIISLGLIPGGNSISPINGKPANQYFFPTELFYSKKSKLVQLGIEVDKNLLYPKNYPYKTSTTKSLINNFKNLYKEISDLFKINKKDLILDIGSNDGTLLGNFKTKCRVLGVTPENIGKIAIKNNIPTILDFFSPTLAKKIKKKYGKAKFITATNVFAHMDNISDILKAICVLLDKKGILIIEFHYLVSLINKLQYDSIYAEHYRYYSISSLKYLFDKFELEIIYVKKINTHGGSLRVYAARKGSYKRINSFSNLIKYEKEIFFKKNIFNFKERVIKSKFQFYKLLQSIKKRKIYGISAPSRATTLINYLGLNRDILECILEIDGSKKIGHYLPGTDIPIYNEKKLYKDQPTYALLLAWHIKDELIKNLRKKGYKGKFIIPLPRPMILN